MSRNVNHHRIRISLAVLEKQNESYGIFRKEVNKEILTLIRENLNLTEEAGLLELVFSHSLWEQQHQLIDFYKAVNPADSDGVALCDRAFLALCNEKINSVVIPYDVKMTLRRVLKMSEDALAMRDKLLLLVAGVVAGYVCSQSSIFTVFILAVLATLGTDLRRMATVFDFVCKLGDKLDSLLTQTALDSASTMGMAK